MSNKLMYRLGLEELVEETADTTTGNETEVVEKAAEMQSDIQSDLGDIEKLQDDHETLREAGAALEAAMKNGYPTSSLTFVRQTVQRIDNRWGMHHKVASMESGVGDAELIASMESAVADGIKKTGKAVMEMLKRVWEKLKEWVGILVEKIGNGVKKLGGLLKRSKELQEEVPKEKQHVVDRALLAEAIGTSSAGRLMELFSVDGGKSELGGVKVYEIIASRHDAGISHMTAAINLLNQLHGKVKPDFTPEDVGEIVNSYINDAYPRRVTDQAHQDAPAGDQHAWTLMPVLSSGYAFVMLNGFEYGKHSPTPSFPRIAFHKTNWFTSREASSDTDIEGVAKRLVVTPLGDISRLSDIYSKLSDKTVREVREANKRHRDYSAQICKFCEDSKVQQNSSLNRYLSSFVSGSGMAVIGSTRALDASLVVMNTLLSSYIEIMNSYWELVAKKSQPAA
jgi:gas vesicle protein